MLAELARQHSHHAWKYGVVLSDRELGLHGRVRVNGEPVDRAVLDQCRRDCKPELTARFFAHAPQAPSAHLEADRADAMVVNIALRVFEKLGVTAIALAAARTGLAPEAPPDGRDVAGGSHWSIERLVMELHRPKVVVCGLEPLPAYLTRLPDSWRRGLIYLTRHPVRIVSLAQPGPVRMHLHGLAKVFAVAVEPARPLAQIPACANLVPGIFGQDQDDFAALALAACQAWASQLGLLLDADAPHRPPQWALRGVSSARCPWLSHTPQPASDADELGCHYTSAETPGEYRHAGEWFDGICKERPASRRMLLIHLPPPVMAPRRYVSEEDGQWRRADYRELLQSLHRPLRRITWSFCVFVADMRREPRAVECGVPPDLPQHIPREFWADITGLRTDQIAIAPDLASALQLE
ncbi:hypothetical protein H4R19_001535 [Coemansia spiralis]|nr:hypothetical protein H4R19_001535 [Coemansia spiralis]